MMFNTFDWHPPARHVLVRQAVIVKQIRAFFESRGLLEVNTPILSLSTTPDPAINSVKAILHNTPIGNEVGGYLHTSPEFAMKRLLVEGSGDIYQLCPVFRDSDCSPVHNPEFIMLEWYRLGFDHRLLMNELYDLMNKLNGTVLPRVDYSYKALFEKYTGFDPFTINLNECCSWCKQHDVTYPDSMTTVDEFLDLILSFVIQPQFNPHQLTFIYDYPPSQSALAKVRMDQGQAVASRFEMYWGALELANGFHELQDPVEQRQRFENENAQRKDTVTLDEAFLQALQNGLPDCAGVALGISRLLTKLPG